MTTAQLFVLLDKNTSMMYIADSKIFTDYFFSIIILQLFMQVFTEHKYRQNYNLIKF